MEGSLEPRRSRLQCATALQPEQKSDTLSQIKKRKRKKEKRRETIAKETRKFGPLSLLPAHGQCVEGQGYFESHSTSLPLLSAS